MMREFGVKTQLGKPNIRWDGNIRFDDFYIRTVRLYIIKGFSPTNLEMIVLKQY